MRYRRTIQGKVFSLRVYDADAASSHGLAGSIAYAQQRHAETGTPYLVGVLGHVMVDCRNNRTVLREIASAGIAGVTVRLNP
jgi:hypothetical protein